MAAEKVEANVAEKAFGLSWRSTVSGIGAALFGILTILAALPYELGDVATIIPPAYKAKVVAIGAVATLALRLWNAVVTKDRAVTGGSIKCDTPVEKVVSS